MNTSAVERDSPLPLDTQLRHLRYGKIPHKFVRRVGLVDLVGVSPASRHTLRFARESAWGVSRRG